MAFEYMVCDCLIHHNVCMFLDGPSSARVSQAAPSATGDLKVHDKAVQLVARCSSGWGEIEAALKIQSSEFVGLLGMTRSFRGLR